MKKTLTANISGTVFHVEEDAYDKLQRYLASIRAQFSGSDGRDEIMADIEARIAELFNERMDGRRQVVNMADVDHVVGIMGQPEDYMGDPLDDEGPSKAQQGTWAGSGQRKHKRLFRDPDDKWVGGVIGGLGAYFNVDPLWFRIAFITLLLIGKGTPILIYILLWILVPVADSAAERLMMQGEPVTVDNLKKTFEEGAEKVKSGAQRVADEADALGKKWSSPQGRERFRSGAQNVGSGLAVVIQKFFGLAFLIAGFVFTMGLLGGLIGTSTFSYSEAGWSGGGFIELGGLIFNSSLQATWFLASVCLLGIIPAIGLMLAGLRLLFDVKSPSWLGWMMGALWFTSLVVVIVTASQVGFDFSKHETVRTEVAMTQPAGQVLYFENLDSEPRSRTNHVSYKHGNLDWEMDDLVVERDSIRLCWTTMDVQRSVDSLFHVRLERRAQARSYKLANSRATNINNTLHQVDSVLFLSQWLSFPRTDKFRVQRAHLVVEVPVGKAIHFGNTTGPLLDDVDNVTNTYDGDMVGITWTMTRRGLSKDITPDQVPDEVLPAPPVAEPRRDRSAEKPNVPQVQDGPTVNASPSEATEPQNTSLMPSLLGMLFHAL